MAEIASAYPTAGGLYYWASKLGSPALGLVHRLVQPRRPDRRHRGDRVRARDLRDGAPQLLVRLPEHEGVTSTSLYAVVLLLAVLLNMPQREDHRRCSTRSRPTGTWPGVAIIVLVLIFIPDNHQSFGYVFSETINNSGFSGSQHVRQHRLLVRVRRLGLLMSQYTITGYDASAHMAEETHQASRMAAVGMYMRSSSRSSSGWSCSLAVTFADPGHAGAIENVGIAVLYIWTESMSQNWAEIAALHLLRRAVLLPDGVHHVRLAHDVRVLARPRRPGPSAVAAGRTEPRAALCRAARSASWPAITDAAHDLELPGRLLVGTVASP